MRKPRKIVDRTDNFPLSAPDAGQGDFVVPTEIAQAYRRYRDMVRVAAPSERVHAFTLAARSTRSSNNFSTGRSRRSALGYSSRVRSFSNARGGRHSAGPF
jgi:hypothetical protein